MSDSFRQLAFALIATVPVIASAQEAGSVFLRLKGTSHTATILGVLNVSDPRLTRFSDDVFHELSSSSAVRLMTPRYDLVALLDSFPFAGKGNLEHLLNNTHFLALDEVCERFLGESAWNFMRMKPLALRSMLEQKASRPANDKTAGDDLSIIAREQGKEITNTLDPSLAAAIRTVPETVQADMLISLVARLADKDYTSAMLKFYLDGNMDALSRLVALAEHIEYAAQLREAWIADIFKTLTSTSSNSDFFIVDATLLGGSQGLIAKLRSANVLVEPLPSGLAYSGNLNVNNPWLAHALRTGSSAAEPLQFFDLRAEYTEERLDSVLPRWYPLVSYPSGFTGRMPMRPVSSMERSRASDDFFTVHIYKWEDIAINSFYTISFSSYPKSYVSRLSGPELFQEVVNQAVSKISGVLLSDIDISSPPVRAREIEIEVEGDFVVRSRFYLIGNRFYQIMVGNTRRTAYSEKDNAFLNSLRIMDQDAVQWQTINLGIAKAELPQAPRREVMSHASDITGFSYSVVDDQTDLRYTISYTPYPSGVSDKSLDQLYNSMVVAAVETLGGTLLGDRPASVGLYPSREVEIAIRENSYCRMRLLMKDNRLVHLIVTGVEESIYSGFVDRFFESLSLGSLEN